MNKIIINSMLIIYLGIGAYSIFISNILWGVIYLILLMMSAVLLSYSYCSKCTSCQSSCAHPQIGILRKYLPTRISVKYKFGDYLGLLPFIITAQLLPQYWLWQNKVIFTIYWVLSIAVILGILLSLCKACENEFCKLNRNPKFK